MLLKNLNNIKALTSLFHSVIMDVMECPLCDQPWISGVKHRHGQRYFNPKFTKRYKTRNQKRRAKAKAKRSKVDNHSQLIICPICKRPKKPVQDHDHDSGRLRSKICNQCNVGLGIFLDDPDLLTRASKYLQYWKSKDLFEKWTT